MVATADGANLPLARALELEERGPDNRWLVEELWGAQATGLLGAEPKSCKTWLALDMALSVASGKPCLRRFAVPEPGPVLYFPAEDAQHIVRERMVGMAASMDVDLDQVPLSFLTCEELRLDTEHGQQLLRQAIEHVRPKLVVLDPFVRLSQADENSASGVGVVLSYLRQLQRSYATAVLLVHHLKKSAGKVRPGQALRGSGDLHGFGDSNLYLARRDGEILLTAEHRGAEGFEALCIELRRGSGEALALHALDFKPEPDEEVHAPASRVHSIPEPRAPRVHRDLKGELEQVLTASGPLSQRELRTRLRARMVAVNSSVRELVEAGRIRRTPKGYQAIVEGESDDIPNEMNPAPQSRAEP